MMKSKNTKMSGGQNADVIPSTPSESSAGGKTFIL